MVRMRKSRLSQAKQYRLMEHFVAGTTARCAAALVGVNSKTAVYYFHRLREIICDHLELEADSVVDGEIEGVARTIIRDDREPRGDDRVHYEERAETSGHSRSSRFLRRPCDGD